MSCQITTAAVKNKLNHFTNITCAIIRLAQEGITHNLFQTFQLTSRQHTKLLFTLDSKQARWIYRTHHSLMQISNESSMLWIGTKPTQQKLHPHQAAPCPSSSSHLLETCSWKHVHCLDKCAPHMEFLMLSAFPPEPWQPKISKLITAWVDLYFILGGTLDQMQL
jgi:hypothetical protein